MQKRQKPQRNPSKLSLSMMTWEQRTVQMEQSTQLILSSKILTWEQKQEQQYVPSLQQQGRIQSSQVGHMSRLQQ